MNTKRLCTQKITRTLLLLISVSLLGFGCNLGSSDNNDQPEQTIVTVTQTDSHGQVISDNLGNVVYFFTRDVTGESNCSGDCINTWPVLTGDLLDSASNLDPENFGSIQRDDGTRQTTYKGWPLYFYSGDDQPVTVNGDGINNVWYVASPNYSLMIADEQLVGADGKNYQSDYTEGDEITTYFTDANGRTLYAFSNDEYNTNNYTEEDFSNNGAWPIFYVEIDSLPSGMNADNFDVIDVYGEQQLTYKGWPLYYFGQDANSGETKGVSAGPEPGSWPVVNSNTEEAPQPGS